MMKKVIVFLLLICLAASLCGCGGRKAPPAGSSASSASGSPATLSGDVTPEKRVTHRLEGTDLTVKIADPDLAGKRVSLLLLTDESHIADYRDDPSVILDIDEALLDESGRAEAHLTLREDIPQAALAVLLAENDCVIGRVR